MPVSSNKGTTTSPPEEVEEDLSTKISRAMRRKIVNHTPKSIDIDCNVQIPSAYFIERDYQAATMKHFGVGDCGYCENNLRDRAIIPIHDDTGKSVVGIIGRTIKEYRLPKFLFHPTGFDKRYYFYNYHRAIKHITDNNIPYLYITEGQGDVWRLYEAGVKNAVSIFGKTLSDQQINKLKSMRVSSLIILTDDDQAGRESKVAISRQLSRTHNLIFPRIYNKDIGNMSIEQIKKDILSNLENILMGRIIGISGRKQSGKSTTANYINGDILLQREMVQNFEIDEDGKLLIKTVMEDGSKALGIFDVTRRDSVFVNYAQKELWPFVKVYHFAEPQGNRY